MLEEKRQLYYTLQELALNIERQDAQIRHLQRTVAALDSRRWLPKIKILGNKEDADENNNNSENNHSNNNSDVQQPAQTIGNYDNGLLFKSLDLIENELFYSENSSKPNDGHRIIHEALVYLKMN